MAALSKKDMDAIASAGPYAGKKRPEIFQLKINDGKEFVIGKTENGIKVIGVEFDQKKWKFSYKRKGMQKVETVNYTQVFKDKDFGGGSAGSGGGADVTAMTESLQCYYCSWVFNFASMHPVKSVSDAQLKAAARYASTDVPLQKCIDKGPEAWVDDGVYLKIANKLYSEYRNKIGGKKTYWHRGDAYMKAIYDQKKKTQKLDAQSDNPQAPGSFSDDKWNPGDIWMSTITTNPIAESVDWATLNQQVYSLGGGKYGNSVTTLGISLKRIAPSATPKIEHYNVPKVAKDYATFTGWKFGKTGEFFSSQDIYIYTSKGDIQFRTFNGATSWQGQIQGSAAAGGKIGGGNVDFYVRQVLGGKGIYNGFDGKSPEAQLITSMNQNKNHAQEMYKLYVSLNSKQMVKKPVIPEAEFVAEWNKSTPNFRNSKSICLYFLQEFYRGKKSQQDDIVGRMFLYAASNTDQSSYFIKVS
jgi:hypothetical protein